MPTHLSPSRGLPTQMLTGPTEAGHTTPHGRVDGFLPGAPSQIPPTHSPEDRFPAEWLLPVTAYLPPNKPFLSALWGDSFSSQLEGWRNRSPKIRASAQALGLSHPMHQELTWAIPVAIPMGEGKPPKDLLVLVGLPPMEVVMVGDNLAVSDPHHLERPFIVAQMPHTILRVSGTAMRLQPQDLEEIVWAAWEDRLALVGYITDPKTRKQRK